MEKGKILRPILRLISYLFTNHYVINYVKVLQSIKPVSVLLDRATLYVSDLHEIFNHSNLTLKNGTSYLDSQSMSMRLKNFMISFMYYFQSFYVFIKLDISQPSQRKRVTCAYIQVLLRKKARTHCVLNLFP